MSEPGRCTKCRKREAEVADRDGKALCLDCWAGDPEADLDRTDLDALLADFGLDPQD